MTYYQALLDVTEAIACCGFYSFVCLLFGTAILRVFHIRPLQEMSIAGYIGSAFFIGQGTFGAIWQTVATLDYFSTRVITAILLVAGLSGIINLRAIYKLTLNRFTALFKETWNLGLIWVVLIVLFIVLIAIFSFLSLHPPGTDALAYYLAQSKVIAAAHKLHPLAQYEAMAQLGLNAEMHAAVLFSLGGDVVGEYASIMSTFVTALANASLLWAISSCVGLGRRGQWLVMVMLFSTNGFTNVMWDGKTDLYGTGLGLAAIYWTLQIGKLPDWIALVIGGLLAGFAMNSKMSLIVVMIPMLVILATWLLLSDKGEKLQVATVALRSRRVILGLLIAGGSSFITFLLLCFKNALIFNEPLAPFFFIHSSPISILDQVWFSSENTQWIVKTYPLALIFGKYPMQHGNITPLFLVFLPLLIFLPKSFFVNHKRLMQLTISSLIAVIVWVIVRPSIVAPRYILPPLLTLLPIAGYAAEQLWQHRKYFFLKLTVISAAIAMTFLSMKTLDIERQVADQYWKTSTRTYANPIWASLRTVNEKAAKGEMIFLSMWYRSPLRPDLLQCIITKEAQRAVIERQNISLWEAIYMQGGTWLVLDRLTHGKEFKEPVDPNNAPNFLSIITYPINDRFTVYQIIPREDAPKPIRTSVQQEDGTWKIQKKS